MATQYTVNDFVKLGELLMKGPDKDRWETLSKIRKASSIEENPPLDLIIQANLVPMLLTFHRDRDVPETSLQDLLWTLANIGSGDAEETLYIVQQGGIEYFLEFTEHHSENVYGQALWGLANIAGESAKFRDLLLGKGVLPKTIDCYYKRRTMMKVETRRTIAWLINNLCRNKPAVQLKQIQECLPYLASSLKDQDHDVVVENLWSCAYITEISDEACQMIMNKHLTEGVVAHLGTNMDRLTIVTPALKTCSNLVAGTDEMTEAVINLNVIPIVITFLNSQKPIVRRETCYFLSNVAASIPSHIALLFNQPNFLANLMNIIRNDDPGVVNEAVWIICNSLMGNTQAHARKLIINGVFLPIFQRLSSVSKRTQLMALEGFREMLNHSMDMLDTPAALLSQVKYYKDNVEKPYLQMQDQNFGQTLTDIDNLISDILYNATPEEKNGS